MTENKQLEFGNVKYTIQQMAELSIQKLKPVLQKDVTLIKKI